MTNELRDGKLVRVGGERVGYEAGVAMVFFFGCLFFFLPFLSFYCCFLEHRDAHHEELQRNYSC